MNNLLLIDGNNFMFRCFWAQKLTSGGKNIEVIYAGFRNLIALVRKFRKEHEGALTTVMCWDGGYNERRRISEEAKSQNIINVTYKQARRDNKASERNSMTPEELKQALVEEEDRDRQLKEFEELLKLTNIQQVFLDGEEADDVIATYATKYRDTHKVFIVSSDQDYYQLIDDNISIYNAHKAVYVGKEILTELGFKDSRQFIDVGALCGDASDTIVGIHGWGWVTAVKYIARYGDVESMFTALKSKGKLSAKETKALESEKVVAVAKRLKAMRRNLDAPAITSQKGDGHALECAFRGLNFMSLMSSVDSLVTEEVDLEKVKRFVKIVTGSNLGEVKTCGCGKQFIGGNVCPDCQLAPIKETPQVEVVQADKVPQQGTLF